jgi:hypothetical protein
MTNRRSSLACLAAGAFCFAAHPCALAQEHRDGVADALAGHRAEMRQWTGEDDPLRRPLFFDPVDIESAPAGVPCDHVARRRPGSVAGVGWVALLRAPDGRLIRYWAPPSAPNDASGIDIQARDFAAAHTGASVFRPCRASLFRVVQMISRSA